MKPTLFIVAFLFLVSAGFASAAEIDTANIPKLLNGLAWRGPGATMQDLSGKTVVVINYVTWCPKCNAWSPDLFNQVKAAAAGEPVIVVAICTDEESVPGPVYMKQRNFVGPNILHAFHPKGHERIGEGGSSLFTGVIINPQGEIAWKGASGAYYDDPGGKEFVIANKISKMKGQGEFRIVTTDMPPEVQRILWPMEMGQVVSGRDLNRVRSKLSADGRAALDQAVESFVEKQLAQINELKEGEVPQQLMAFQKAGMLSKTFPATEAGKEAKQLWLTWNRDSRLKREMTALKAYDKMSLPLTKASGPRRKNMLAGFVRRYEETYAASMANERIAQEETERISPED